MNLFAAVHARSVGAALVAAPGRRHAPAPHAGRAHRRAAGGHRPAAAAPSSSPGTGCAATSRRGRRAAGATRSPTTTAPPSSPSSPGAPHEEDLRPFPDVDVEIRDGRIWARSPFLSRGYAGGGRAVHPRPPTAFATVGDRGRLDGGVLTVTGRGGGRRAHRRGHRPGRRRRAGAAPGDRAPTCWSWASRTRGWVPSWPPSSPTRPRCRGPARPPAASSRRPSGPAGGSRCRGLPVTAAGKVDRAAVAELAADGPAGTGGRPVTGTTPRSSSPPAAPRSGRRATRWPPAVPPTSPPPSSPT